jgi:DNA-binding transcriptional MerR regulator
MSPPTRARRGAQLARPARRLVAIETIAQDAGVHPDIVRRLVRLGLIEPSGGTRAAPLFSAQDAALVSRAIRLRRDLGVNYAGAVLAVELLARIEELELRLHTGAPTRPGTPTRKHQEVIAWTRTVSR